MQVGAKIQLISLLLLLAGVESLLAAYGNYGGGKGHNARNRAPNRKAAANKQTVINNINVQLSKSQQQEALKQTADDDLIDEMIRRRQQRLQEQELQQQQEQSPEPEPSQLPPAYEPPYAAPPLAQPYQPPYQPVQPPQPQPYAQPYPAGYPPPEFYPNELVNNQASPDELYNYQSGQAYAPPPDNLYPPQAAPVSPPPQARSAARPAKPKPKPAPPVRRNAHPRKH